MKVKFEDLNQRYEELTSKVICTSEMATPLAGGQPATRDGIQAFVEHHLHLEGPAAEDAIRRILEEEVGEKPIPEPEGELQEKLTYGVNIIRRTPTGPYLGSWMIHACLKQAASRLGIFVEVRGSKGNFAEAGRVLPCGISKLDDNPSRVYLIGPGSSTGPVSNDTSEPVVTYWEEFKGRVSSPQGNKSIVHHTECAPPGTRFEFEFRFIRGPLTDGDIQDFLALAMVVGLGSAKSLGCGKWKILEAEIMQPERVREKKKTTSLPVEEVEAKKLQRKAEVHPVVDTIISAGRKAV